MHTGGCTVAEASEVVNQASGCLSACSWIGWLAPITSSARLTLSQRMSVHTRLRRWLGGLTHLASPRSWLIPPNPSSPSRCPFQIRCQYPRCHGPGKWLIVDPSSSIPCGLQGSVDSAVPSQCRRSIDCFWVDEHVFCLVEGWGWMGSWMARQHSGRESLVDSIRAGNVPMHGMHVIWTGNPHFERANLWAGQRGMRARVHPLATMHPCSQKSDSPRMDRRTERTRVKERSRTLRNNALFFSPRYPYRAVSGSCSGGICLTNFDDLMEAKGGGTKPQAG